MEGLIGADLVCPIIPNICVSASSENLPSCKDNICRKDGRCDLSAQSQTYQTCVNAWKNGGGDLIKLDDCACDEEKRERAIIDIYLRNASSETFELDDAPKNWVVIGTKTKTCKLGDWVLEPPKTLQPQSTFIARAYSGRIGEDDACKNNSIFEVCFDYTSQSDSNTKFTIFLQRKRGSRSGGECPHWGKTISNSSFSSTLAPSDAQFVDHSTYGFNIVKTGQGPPEGGCTLIPDSCPTGHYCSQSASGNTCLSGCKISPDSCVSSGTVCSPSTRNCITPQPCTRNSDCNLGFICNIATGSNSGICIPGCTVNGVDDNSRCATGFTCMQGQCFATGTTGTNGSDTRLRNELLIGFGILIFIVIVAGIIYVIYSSNTPPTTPTT